MDVFDFEKIIYNYSKPRPKVRYEGQKNKSEKEEIELGVNNSFGFDPSLSEQDLIRLRSILFLILSSIDVQYMECFTQVAAVIVHHLFLKPESASFVDDDSSLHLSEDVLREARVIITNIVREKFEPLVEEDLRMYLRYNRVFIKMMEKRKVSIPLDISLTYMNYTLNWMIPSCRSLKDIKIVVGWMMITPTSFPFLLLVKFFDEIEQGKKIKITKSTYRDLIKLESEFLHTEDIIEREKHQFKFSKGELMVLGATAAIGIAFLVAMCKRDSK